MPQELEEQPAKKRVIDLREIAQAVFEGWRIVVGCIGIFLLLAIINLHSTPSVFAVKMTVTPVQGQGDQSSSKVSSLTSLAQLAGLSLGPSAGQSASQFRLYVESLHSRDLADDLAKNQDLMKAIFGGEWDEETHSWKEPKPGIVHTMVQPIMELLGSRPLPWQPPDGAKLQQYLAEPDHLVITQDIKKPDFVTVEFDSANTEFAIKLLSVVNQTADNHLRKKALLRATQYIDYLSKELNNVTVAEHREAIMQALSEQEKFKMSASSAVPYAAEVFDKPWASLERLRPKASQALPQALLEGALVGAAIVLLLNFLRNYVRQRDYYWPLVEKLPVFLRRPLRL